MDSPAWIKLRHQIESGDQDITDALSHLTKNDAERIVDEKGWTILHHAIAKNSTGAVKCMFQCGMFTTHKSETIPYLHLACACGHLEMVDLLVSERVRTMSPGKLQKSIDWRDVISIESEHWKALVAACPVPDKNGDRTELFLRKNRCITPWAVAALYLQSECLERLLMSCPEWFGRCDDFGYTIYRLMSQDISDKGRADALRQLLQLLLPDEAFASAFKHVLAKQSPASLEVMLQYIKDHKPSVFELNPYYIVFTHDWYDWSAEDNDCPALRCTQMLLEDNWDVNEVYDEPGTFPLYILLLKASIHEFGERDEELKEHLACVRELLAAGADPNFNERPGYDDEEYRSNDEYHTKLPFSCAAEVLSRFVLERGGSNEYKFKFATEIVELLIKYGANLGYRDENGNSVLHSAMSFAILALDSKYVNMDVVTSISKTISNLILQGANLQSENCEGCVPIVHFVEWFVEKRGYHDHECYTLNLAFLDEIEQGGYQDDAEEEFCDNCNWRRYRIRRSPEKWDALCSRMMLMFRLLDAMEWSVVVEAVQDCKLRILCNEIIPHNVKETLCKDLRSYRSVRSLYRSCLVKVWHYCGCRQESVKELELALTVKDSLIDMFSIV